MEPSRPRNCYNQVVVKRATPRVHFLHVTFASVCERKSDIPRDVGLALDSSTGPRSCGSGSIRTIIILFDATVSTALFLSLVVLAMLLCRQPARRIRIARVALLSSLMMIPMVALAPLPRLDITDTIIRSDLIPAQLIFNPDQKTPTSASGSPSERVSWFISSGFSAELSRVGRWLERGLTLIDLVAVSIGLGWFILGCWGVRWLIRHSQTPSASAKAIFDRLQIERGTARRRAALRVSSRINRPVVVGLLRPTILIPRSFDELDDDGELLRLTLLHEIAHAERLDPWFCTAASLAQTLCFPPSGWWLGRNCS